MSGIRSVSGGRSAVWFGLGVSVGQWACDRKGHRVKKNYTNEHHQELNPPLTSLVKNTLLLFFFVILRSAPFFGFQVN